MTDFLNAKEEEDLPSQKKSYKQDKRWIKKKESLNHNFAKNNTR